MMYNEHFSIFYGHKSTTPNVISITVTTTCNTMYYTTYNNGITIANCNTKWSLPLPMPLTLTITINHHWSKTLKKNKKTFLKVTGTKNSLTRNLSMSSLPKIMKIVEYHHHHHQHHPEENYPFYHRNQAGAQQPDLAQIQPL